MKSTKTLAAQRTQRDKSSNRKGILKWHFSSQIPTRCTYTRKMCIIMIIHAYTKYLQAPHWLTVWNERLKFRVVFFLNQSSVPIYIVNLENSLEAEKDYINVYAESIQKENVFYFLKYFPSYNHLCIQNEICE